MTWVELLRPKAQQFAPREHDGALQFLSWTTTNALAAAGGSF